MGSAFRAQGNWQAGSQTERGWHSHAEGQASQDERKPVTDFPHLNCDPPSTLALFRQRGRTHTPCLLVPAPGWGSAQPYLQEVILLVGQNLALPPALQEPPELHEEQQEVVLELLGFLHQYVLLLAPEFLLQPPLEAQTLQLELPPQQRSLLVFFQLSGWEGTQEAPADSRSRSRAEGNSNGKCLLVPASASTDSSPSYPGIFFYAWDRAQRLPHSGQVVGHRASPRPLYLQSWEKLHR